MSILGIVKSLKPTRPDQWLMLSIALYSISSFLNGIVSPFISKMFLYLGCLIYIYLILFKRKGVPLSGFTRFAFVFLLVWTVCLTIRMFFETDLSQFFPNTATGGVSSYLSLLFDSLVFFPHLLPFCLFLFCINDGIDFRYFVRISLLFSIAYLLLYPVVVRHLSLIVMENHMELGNSMLGISSFAPSVCLLYWKKYLPKKEWLMFTLIYIASLAISIYTGRRGGSALGLLYLLTVWLLYISSGRSNSRFQTAIVGLLILGVVYIIFTNTSDSFFSYILERGLQDNRSDRNEDFIMDVFATNDIYWGRGWFGQYYDRVYGFRGSIETGALALILRGGFLYLIPYAIILSLTFYNGFFRSKNILCKSFGIISLLQIISLYPWGWPLFNFNYLMLWLGVFLCNKKSIRNMSEVNIKNYFFKNV